MEPMFFTDTIEDCEIKEYEKARAIKDAHHDSNTFAKGKIPKYRWSGEYLEDVFERFLIENKLDYERESSRYRVDNDPYDFLFNGYRIDVKGQNRLQRPTLADTMQIPMYNLKKIDEIDIFVFSRFDMNARKGYLLGWLWSHETRDAGILILEGEIACSQEYGKLFKTRTDTLNIPIIDLRKMDTLHTVE